MSELLLRNVRPWPSSVDDTPVDVLMVDGVISEVGPNLTTTGTVEDGLDHILLPAFTDAHAHLDSTRLGLPFRPHSAGPGLEGLIENDRHNWRSAERSVTDRATHTLGRTIAFGATRVRSHAQVDPDSGLDRLEGVLAAKREHKDRCDVEVVAFPQTGILRSPGTRELLSKALEMGADYVGGIDPEGLDRKPEEHLEIVFGLAHDHGAGVDIHLHDRGEVGARQIEMICARAVDLPHRVNISHCFGLTTVDEVKMTSLLETMSSASVTITTVAPGTTPPMPLEKIGSLAIDLGLGQDGIRDYWSPYGNGDMLDRTWQLAFTNGFRHDNLIEACVAIATSGGAAIMGVSNVGVAPGDVADLVVVPGDTVTAAVMDRPPRTMVIKNGSVVARGGILI